MTLTAKIDYTKYTDAIRTIEAHTEGEYCRVALDCPETEGNTMIERKTLPRRALRLRKNCSCSSLADTTICSVLSL